MRLSYLEGCIVTINAVGCQMAIAQIIRNQQAGYGLALKENRGSLYQDVVLASEEALSTDFRGVAHDQRKTVDIGHGRLEIRRYWTIGEEQYLRYFSRGDQWPGLRSVAMVETERRVGEDVSRERRYDISSLAGDAQALAQAIRGHWGTANCLHWVLDIAFREDDCGVRQSHADENLAVLRRIALNLLKQ